jgi:uncharacterized membrane protein (UPF0127 family)
MRLLPIFLTALTLAACSPQTGKAPSSGTLSQSQSARHPVSGLAVVPLTVIHDGTRHAFRVEVAQSEAEQEKGLMFRTSMGADEGMIFPRAPATPAAFWMKNTVIPLDIIFIGPDRRITNIEANAEPYSLTPRLSGGAAAAVLELNGGRAAELGIGPGDSVEW